MAGRICSDAAASERARETQEQKENERELGEIKNRHFVASKHTREKQKRQNDFRVRKSELIEL